MKKAKIKMGCFISLFYIKGYEETHRYNYIQYVKKHIIINIQKGEVKEEMEKGKVVSTN